MKATMTVTSFFACALALAATTDKVSFDWNPVKGSKAQYTTTNWHEADMGGGIVDLVITWGSTITVEKVDGKKVWLDVVNDDPMVEIDGGPANGVHVRIDDEVVELGLGGKFYQSDDSDRDSLGLYSGFQFPKSPVEKGDSYEIGGLKAKYHGVEKVKKWEAHKFTFEYRSGKSDADLWSKGTIWLSTEDLTLVKRTAELHNINFGMGPEDMNNEIVRTK